MSYGVRALDGAGRVLFNSPDAIGSLTCEAVQVTAAASPVIRNYTQWAGRTLTWAAVGTSFSTEVSVSVSYSSGYPSVSITTSTNWTNTTGSCVVYIFIN